MIGRPNDPRKTKKTAKKNAKKSSKPRKSSTKKRPRVTVNRNPFKGVAPKELNADGKKEWKRVIAELKDAGILHNLDRAVVLGYCEAWGEFIALTRRAKKTGPVTVTDKGNTIQHPVLSAKNKASERFLRFAAQLGLTPAARAKLTDIETTSTNDLNKYT